MPSDSKLPLYSEIPAMSEGMVPLSAQITAKRIAGDVQTCSIKDFQLDYFKIVRKSATSYYICLTVDPTPIYRIEFVTDSTKIGDILIFSASDTALPAVAAVRLSRDPQSKTEPVAMICTSEPSLSGASWRSLARSSLFGAGEHYNSLIPIITVPGMAPALHKLGWRVREPFFELWWDGPLPLMWPRGFRNDDRELSYVFARVVTKESNIGENLIEMRRGGGLEFELTVVLQIFVILQHLKKEFT